MVGIACKSSKADHPSMVSGGRVDVGPQDLVAYSTIVETANPVPPLGCDGRVVLSDAGPAMSMCTHGVSLANVLRNSPAVIAPPNRSPVLRMSAIGLLSCSRSRALSGSLHMSSPVRSATDIQLRTRLS